MGKTSYCKLCGTTVTNVNSDSVICWQCTIELTQKLETPAKKKTTTAQGYPKGWRFMKVFVHVDGKVYHKGVEQPELKDTLPPTPIIVKPKKTSRQRKEEKHSILLKYNEIKKQLKNENRKTYRKKLEAELKKLQRHI